MWTALEPTYRAALLARAPERLQLLAGLCMLAGLGMCSNALWELQESASPYLAPCSSHRLVSTGLYSLVRHPLYGGLVLLSFGWAVGQG